MRAGSTWTCIIWSRSPQIATLATPGTCNSLARIVQYEIIDISIRDLVFEESPIFITRLVADTGWSMTGGAAQVGIVGITVWTRSDTSCRACNRSVPCLKRSSIEESWAIDLDRSVSRPGTPLSAASSGTVTRDSTSAADRPRHGV